MRKYFEINLLTIYKSGIHKTFLKVSMQHITSFFIFVQAHNPNKKIKEKSPVRDLNTRPADYKSAAIPLSQRGAFEVSL